jgi:Zn ribbon nucleic-acid-binding protein
MNYYLIGHLIILFGIFIGFLWGVYHWTKMITKKKNNITNVATKERIAWCPDCGDGLETIKIWKDDNVYYCFGCSKTFILVPKTVLTELDKQ